VAAGRLSVNGSLGNSAVAVLAAAELGGSGSIAGPVSIAAGGMLAPGNSIAALAAGATSFASATFAYEVDSSAALAAAADLLVVSGNLDIAAGSLLALTDIAGTTAPFVENTTVFAMMNYSGSWSGGLFTSNGTPLADGSRFTVGSQQWEIDYNRTSAAGLANFTGDYLPNSSFVAITAVPEPSTLVLTALGVGMAGGALNGVLVTRCRIAPFVATLGTMSIFRSLTLYCIDAGEYRCVSDAYRRLGAGSLLGLFIPVWLFLALAAALQVLLTRTRYGRYVLAVGANEQVARYSAIRVELVRFVTYVLTGFTVGVTAVMFGSRLNAVSSSNMGLYYEMDAIAAVVIGGTSMAGGSGAVLGTVLGAIILGIINNMLNMLGVSPYLQGTVKGAVIILAVLVQYQAHRRA